MYVYLICLYKYILYTLLYRIHTIKYKLPKLLVQACQGLDEQRQPVGKAAQAEPPLLQLLECRQVGLGVVHDDTNQPLRVARGHLHGELHVLLYHPLSVLAHLLC